MLGFHNRPPQAPEDVYLLKSTIYELQSAGGGYGYDPLRPQASEISADFSEGALYGLGMAIGISAVEAAQESDLVSGEDLTRSIKLNLTGLFADVSNFKSVNEGMNRSIVTARHFTEAKNGVAA